jgi:cation:H+ antiporter
MVAVSVLVFVMALDRVITRTEGVLLFIGYVVFTIVLYRLSTRRAHPDSAQVQDEVEILEGDLAGIRKGRQILMLLLSIAVLVAGAQFTVMGASGVARALGISELIIGLTLVAVGTSLPEIATAIAATVRKHDDLAAGNAVGSNIANLLVILAITAIILPVPVPEKVLQVEMPVMIGFSLVLMLLSFRRRLPRWSAGLLLAAYLAFVVITFIAPA